jgi:hypothetical protein
MQLKVTRLRSRGFTNRCALLVGFCGPEGSLKPSLDPPFDPTAGEPIFEK